MGFLSYEKTNKQTPKQILQLYIYLSIYKLSFGPREDLWVIIIKKNWVQKFFYLSKKNLNLENPRFFFFVFNVYNEKMFTIEIEDGAKRPKSLVYHIFCEDY